MPEIAETAIFAESIRDILQDNYLTSITVLGGKYKVYEILDSDGVWIDKLINPKTKRKNNIDPKKHPGGRYTVKLTGLTEIRGQLPLKIENINTKGKCCYVKLEKEWYITFAFGMSGSIKYDPTKEILDRYAQRKGKRIDASIYCKHFHVKFTNAADQSFYFDDPRRFGRIEIIRGKTNIENKLQKLGADLLQTDWTSEEFRKMFQLLHSSTNICKAMMNQHLVAGIGNYMVNEILYRCRINPWAQICDLDDQTVDHLFFTMKSIAKQAYDLGGTSLQTYVDSQGRVGKYQNLFKVYKKPCDPFNNKVVIIPAREAPDRRTKHYVPQIQFIGEHNDPDRDLDITYVDTESDYTIDIDF